MGIRIDSLSDHVATLNDQLSPPVQQYQIPAVITNALIGHFPGIRIAYMMLHLSFD